MPVAAKLFLSIFSAVLTACAIAPTEKEPLNETQEIPFHYLSRTFIVVPVKVSGTRDASFVLDTGVGVNLISTGLCQELHCKTKETFSGKRMSGQEVQFPLTRVATLALGDRAVENVPVGVFDVESLMPGQKIDGFLSLAFFNEIPFSVDYARKVLVIENIATLKRAREEGIPVPVKVEVLGPSVDIFMPITLPDEQTASVEVDTGSQALILDERFMEPLDIKPGAANVKERDGQDETGHTYRRYFTRLKGRIYVPQSQLLMMDQPEVMFQKIIYDGLIGHHFLSQFKVTYDLPRQEIIFQKP